jgi:signal transduction histidine kinase
MGQLEIAFRATDFKIRATRDTPRRYSSAILLGDTPRRYSSAILLGGATLTISDRGSGMTDDMLKNALPPFLSTKEKGMGLGLALCREIVDARRGKLRVARRDGGGIIV